MVPGQQLVLEHSEHTAAYQCSHATRYTAHCYSSDSFIGPILWGHSGPLCHALSLLSSSSSLLWTSMRRRRATVATPGEWQCGVRQLAVANGPNIFQMLFVSCSVDLIMCARRSAWRSLYLPLNKSQILSFVRNHDVIVKVLSHCIRHGTPHRTVPHHAGCGVKEP